MCGCPGTPLDQHVGKEASTTVLGASRAPSPVGASHLTGQDLATALSKHSQKVVLKKWEDARMLGNIFGLIWFGLSLWSILFDLDDGKVSDKFGVTPGCPHTPGPLNPSQFPRLAPWYPRLEPRHGGSSVRSKACNEYVLCKVASVQSRNFKTPTQHGLIFVTYWRKPKSLTACCQATSRSPRAF